MAENPLVQRLHQQVRQESDQQWLDACDAVRNWRDMAYGLLAEVRRNLPVIVQRSEGRLMPLNLTLMRKEGKGRKQRTVFEYEQTAGWMLRSWKEWDSTGEREASAGKANYLLYDGRLAVGGDFVTASVDVLDDRALLEMIRPGLWRNHDDARRVPAQLASLLWHDPGFTRTHVPAVPELPSWCESIWEKMGELTGSPQGGMPTSAEYATAWDGGPPGAAHGLCTTCGRPPWGQCADCGRPVCGYHSQIIDHKYRCLPSACTQA